MYLPQRTSAFGSSCKRVLHEPYTLHLICYVRVHDGSNVACTHSETTAIACV